MKKTAVNRLFMMLAMSMVLLAFTVASAVADDYSASTIRLLHYEGDVEIEDANGNSRFVVENIRFGSGESMATGADSTASVSLDSSKILTLDQQSKVTFEKQGNALKLTLTEGTLLLDVQEKLDENESLDIQTSTMVVGIRGTVVFISDQPADDNTLTLEGVSHVLDTEWANNGGRVTTLGVLEGTANVTYLNQGGQLQTLQVPAGFKATMVDSNQDGVADVQPEKAEMTAQDIAGFVATQVQSDSALMQRVQNGCDVLDQLELYPADGDWQWTDKVTLVAQSASKMFDGTPLTRFGGVLVYNLPLDFSIEVYANGSLTEAGETVNPIAQYKIFNAKGEDVTRHFTNIETVSGSLVVAPAPVTVWTGSAAKVYDGTPLTNKEAMLRTAPGYEYGEPTWRNTSTVVSEADGSEVLYGLSGITWAHGTNPLTGETTEIAVSAGQKMSVYLSDTENGQSIEFKVENITEKEIPEEMLRIYAANPDLLAQACQDAGWDIDVIRALIAALPPLEKETATVQQDGLSVSAEEKDRMMRDFTNVRIAIDSEITDYNDRALDSNEAHYTRVDLDQSVVITATGSQTEVGQSDNTYEIDWGTVNPDNYYILTEELGTLTVYQCSVSFEMSYSSTAYTGAPILPDSVVAVLPDGTRVEGALVLAAAGPVDAPTSFVRYFTLPGAKVKLECEGYTDVGTYTVTPTLTFLSGREYNYNISFTGNTFTIGTSEVTLELGGSASVPYDGAFHGGAPAVTTASGSATVTQTGDATWSVSWPWGGESTLTIQGGGVDAGEYTLTGSLSNADNLDVVLTGETLTITPLDVTLNLGGGSIAYTGEEYFGNLTVSCESATPEVTEITEYYEAWEDHYLPYSHWSIQWPWGETQELFIGYLAEDGDEKYMASPYNAGSYTLAYEWWTDVSSNFNFTASNTALTITPIQLTVTVHPKDEYVYGDAFFIWADDSDGFITASTTPETDIDVQIIEGDVYEIMFLDFNIGVQPVLEGELYHSYLDVKAGENSISTVLYPWSDDNPFYYGDPANVNITFETTTFNVLPLDITIDLGGGTYDLGDEPDGPSVTFHNGDWAEETEPFEVYEYDEVTGTYSYSMSMSGGDTLYLDITPNETGDFTYTLDHSVLILDYDETDKSGNYTIAYANETLEFEYSEDAVTLYGGSAEKTFDGAALTNDEITFEGLPDGYTVTGTCSGSQTDAGENENDVADYQIWDADGNEKTEYFINVSTVPGTLTVNPLPVTISMTSERYPYRGVYQGVNVQITCDNTNYTLSGEEWTRDDEYNHWHLVWDWGDQLDFDINGGLDVGTYTCSIGEVTASSGSLENYVITTGESVTKTIYKNSIELNLIGSSLNQTFGTALLSYDPITRYGDGVQGGQEFAPDEYFVTDGRLTEQYTLNTGDELEITYDFSDFSAGTHTITYSTNFLTGSSANYSIYVISGTNQYTISKAPVTITTASAEKEYDGTALTAGVTVEGLVGAPGVTYSDDQEPVVTATGSQLDAGSSTNTYSIDWRAYDENNYTITENLGTLTVTPIDVQITMSDVSVPFDNAYHNPEYNIVCDQDVTIDTSSFYPTIRIADAMFRLVTSPDNMKDAGTWEATGTVEWAYGNQDNFNITVTNGTYTITPVELSVTTGSASKVYDGTPLTSDSASITGMTAGEGIYATATGSVTDVGSAANTYSIDWNGWTSTNYTITENLGTLTVEPLQLSFSLGGTTTTYNSGPATYGDPKLTYLNGPHAGETVSAGTYIRNIGSTEATFDMYTGETVTLTVTGYPYKDAGEYPLAGSCVFIGSSTNYTVVAYTDDQCVVNPAAISVTTDSETKVYDGTPLPVNTSAPISGNLYDYTVFTSVTGSQTDVGSSPNTYEIHWSGIDPNNYTVTENVGTLTVTPVVMEFYVNVIQDRYGEVIDYTPFLTCTEEMWDYEETGDHVITVYWYDDQIELTAYEEDGTYFLEYVFIQGDPQNYAITVGEPRYVVVD